MSVTTLARNLLRVEDPPHVRVNLMLQLIGLLKSNNSAAVRASNLWPQLTVLLMDRSPKICQAAVELLGMLAGILMSSATPNGQRGVDLVLDWLQDALENNIDLPDEGPPPLEYQILVTQAIALALQNPTVISNIQNRASWLLDLCLEILEDNQTQVRLAVKVVEIIIILANNFGGLVENLVEDLIDVVVGWSLDSEVGAADRFQFLNLWLSVGKILESRPDLTQQFTSQIKMDIQSQLNSQSINISKILSLFSFPAAIINCCPSQQLQLFSWFIQSIADFWHIFKITEQNLENNVENSREAVKYFIRIINCVLNGLIMQKNVAEYLPQESQERVQVIQCAVDAFNLLHYVVWDLVFFPYVVTSQPAKLLLHAYTVAKSWGIHQIFCEMALSRNKELTQKVVKSGEEIQELYKQFYSMAIIDNQQFLQHLLSIVKSDANQSEADRQLYLSVISAIFPRLDTGCQQEIIDVASNLIENNKMFDETLELWISISQAENSEFNVDKLINRVTVLLQRNITLNNLRTCFFLLKLLGVLGSRGQLSHISGCCIFTIFEKILKTNSSSKAIRVAVLRCTSKLSKQIQIEKNQFGRIIEQLLWETTNREEKISAAAIDAIRNLLQNSQYSSCNTSILALNDATDALNVKDAQNLVEFQKSGKFEGVMQGVLFENEEISGDAIIDWLCRTLGSDPGRGSSLSFSLLQSLVEHTLQSRLHALNDSRNLNLGQLEKSMVNLIQGLSKGEDLKIQGHFMLRFFFLLEKGMRNIIEGLSNADDLPSKQVVQFFITNQKVCVDWMARLRKRQILASNELGEYHSVVWHGFRRLEHVKQQLLVIINQQKQQQLQQSPNSDNQQQQQQQSSDREAIITVHRRGGRRRDRDRRGVQIRGDRGRGETSEGAPKLLKRGQEITSTQQQQHQPQQPQQSPTFNTQPADEQDANQVVFDQQAKLRNTFLQCILSMSSALTSCESGDILEGLKKYCLGNFQTLLLDEQSLAFLQGCQFQANQQYEQALEVYNTFMEDLSELWDPGCVSLLNMFVWERVAECYAALQWSEKFQEHYSFGMQRIPFSSSQFSKVAELQSWVNLNSGESVEVEDSDSLVSILRERKQSSVQFSYERASEKIYEQIQLESVHSNILSSASVLQNLQVANFVTFESEQTWTQLPVPQIDACGSTKELMQLFNSLKCLQVGANNQYIQGLIKNTVLSGLNQGNRKTVEGLLQNIKNEQLESISQWSSAHLSVLQDDVSAGDQFSMIAVQSDIVQEVAEKLLVRLDEKSLTDKCVSVIATSLPAEVQHCQPQEQLKAWLIQKQLNSGGQEYADYLMKLGVANKAMALAACQNYVSHLQKENNININYPENNSSVVLKLLKLIDDWSEDLLDDEWTNYNLRSVSLQLWCAASWKILDFLLDGNNARAQKWASEIVIQLMDINPSLLLYPLSAMMEMYSENKILMPIFERLQQKYPKLVEQMQVMVTELQQLSYLVDEEWYSLLKDAHSQLYRKFIRLNAEMEWLNKNSNLNGEGKVNMLKQRFKQRIQTVVVRLETHLNLAISKTPRGVHEKQFRQDILPKVAEILEGLKEPQLKGKKGELEMLLKPLRGFLFSMENRLIRGQLPLKQLSPVLVQLQNTVLPIPRMQYAGCLYDPVCVASFGESLSLMNSKTRPRKLYLVGSDGQEYDYLLKIGEDLRQDEQLLHCVRVMNGITGNIAQSGVYDVVPLTQNAGLIAWVEHSTPIFQLFRSWQKNVISRHLAMADIPTNLANPPKQPPAPARLPVKEFYLQKLKNAVLKSSSGAQLKSQMEDTSVSRSKIPEEVLESVFVGCQEECPSNLISNHIWYMSHDASSWWRRLHNYTSSLAAASVTSYLLGLGDRHLDNILIDSHTSQVVNIDYNVNFDKGKKLRVPEVVPFRLTQNFVKGLGPLGVNGGYLQKFVRLMEQMREKSDVLEILLEQVLMPKGECSLVWGWDTVQVSKVQQTQEAFLDIYVNLTIFSQLLEDRLDVLQGQLAQWTGGLGDGLQNIRSFLERFMPMAIAFFQGKEMTSRVEDCQKTIQQGKESQEQASQKLEDATTQLTSQQSKIQELQFAITTNKEDLNKNQLELQSIYACILSGLELELESRGPYLSKEGCHCALSLLGPSQLTTHPFGLVVQTLGQLFQDVPIDKELIQNTYELDVKGMELLNNREQFVLQACVSIQEYSQTVRNFSNAEYPTSTFYAQWNDVLKQMETNMDSSQNSNIKQSLVIEAQLIMPKILDVEEIQQLWYALVLGSQALDLRLSTQTMAESDVKIQYELFQVLDLFDGQAQQVHQGLLAGMESLTQYFSADLPEILALVENQNNFQSDSELVEFWKNFPQLCSMWQVVNGIYGVILVVQQSITGGTDAGMLVQCSVGKIHAFTQSILTFQIAVLPDLRSLLQCSESILLDDLKSYLKLWKKRTLELLEQSENLTEKLDDLSTFVSSYENNVLLLNHQLKVEPLESQKFQQELDQIQERWQQRDEEFNWLETQISQVRLSLSLILGEMHCLLDWSGHNVCQRKFEFLGPLFRAMGTIVTNMQEILMLSQNVDLFPKVARIVEGEFGAGVRSMWIVFSMFGVAETEDVKDVENGQQFIPFIHKCAEEFARAEFKVIQQSLSQFVNQNLEEQPPELDFSLTQLTAFEFGMDQDDGELLEAESDCPEDDQEKSSQQKNKQVQIAELRNLILEHGAQLVKNSLQLCVGISDRFFLEHHQRQLQNLSLFKWRYGWVADLGEVPPILTRFESQSQGMGLGVGVGNSRLILAQFQKCVTELASLETEILEWETDSARAAASLHHAITSKLGGSTSEIVALETALLERKTWLDTAREASSWVQNFSSSIVRLEYAMIGLHWQGGNSMCPFESLYSLMENVEETVKAVELANSEFETARMHSQQVESEVEAAQQMIEVYKETRGQHQKTYNEGLRDFVTYIKTQMRFVPEFEETLSGLQTYLEESVGGLSTQFNVQQLQSTAALQELKEMFVNFENNHKKQQESLEQWLKLTQQLQTCIKDIPLLKEKSLSKKQYEIVCEQCLKSMTSPMQTAQMLLENDQDVQEFVLNIPEILEQLKQSCDSSAIVIHDLYEGGGGEADEIGQQRGQQAEGDKKEKSRSNQQFVKDALKVFLKKLKGQENVTLQEQVEGLIKTASDVKSLSKMYEGWTAWL